MRRTGILLLARMDSRRLPGKAMKDVGCRNLLGRVLDRARLIPGGAQIVVATSDRDIDRPIVEMAEAEGVAVFRGAAEDVAMRVIDCADVHGFDNVARVLGDSPFLDPELFGDFIRKRDEWDCDIVTNVQPRTFPPGMSAEVIRIEALRRALEATRHPSDREHVTRYIYAHPDRFDVRNVRSDTDNSDLTLTVDTEEDLERTKWIASQLQPPVERASPAEIIALARRWAARRIDERSMTSHG